MRALWIWFLVAGWAFAAPPVEEVCPFAPGDEEGGEPIMIRVYLEFVELPHERVTELLQKKDTAIDGAMHKEVRALVKKKEARIKESIMVMARPGQKATVESIMEYIYPSEYEPPGFIGLTPLGDLPVIPMALRGRTWWPAFESRNVGTMLEIEPNVGADESVIDLRFAPELVWVMRHEVWYKHRDQWGEQNDQFPVFEDVRVSTGMTLKAGRFSFVSVFTPMLKNGGRDPEKRMMLFVRADIVSAD